MIIDASVAFKWVVREPDSERAIALLDRAPLVAPDLIFSEIASAIWRKCRRGELATVPLQVSRLASLLRVEATPLLTLRAAQLAIELNHPAYDCVYLALAEAVDDHIITADERFVRGCAGTPHAGRLVPFA